MERYLAFLQIFDINRISGKTYAKNSTVSRNLSTFLFPATLTPSQPAYLLLTLITGLVLGIALLRGYQRYRQRTIRCHDALLTPPPSPSVDSASNDKIPPAALLAMLSHEIRTPLNTILGMVELPMQSAKLPSESRQHLTDALQAIEALQSLLDDILDLSRLQVGKPSVKIAPTELATLLDNIAKLYRVTCEQHGLYFRSQLAIDELRPVLADASKLRQILNNLLSNAVKFTKQGTITLSVSSYPLSDNKMRLEITISDTGIGISEHDLQRLFEPFSQAEDIQQRFGGTGLGLYISQQLTHLMGGSLDIESHLGEGTRAHLEIELSIASGKSTSGNAAWNHLAKQEMLPAFAGGKHALIVDDSDAIRHLLKRQLERMGFTITLANSAQEAEQLWYPCRFDLILVDYHMPGLPGPELVRHLRTLEARHHDNASAIIGFTADTKPESETNFIQAGASLCLNKPVRYGVLYKAAARLVVDNRRATNTSFLWFDSRMLQELSNGDATFEKTFLLSVQKNNRIDVDEAKQAHATHDEERLSSALHRLSGILRLISREHLATRLTQLERAVREHKQEVVQSLLDGVLNDLQRFDDDIALYLNELEQKSKHSSSTN